MIVTFEHALHDQDSETLRSSIETGADIEVSDELMGKIGRPFYEVTLQCTLDTTSGEVTILGVSSSITDFTS
jgi:hypothetical protein